MKKQLFTVFVFAKLNTRRFFRDRLALFFGIMFPVIFLVVLGSLNNGAGNNISFKVSLINQSKSDFSKDFVKQLGSSKTFKIKDQAAHDTFASAKEQLSRGQLDGIIVLPANFGAIGTDAIPGGKAQVYFTQNNEQAGQTLVSVLDGTFKGINAKYVPVAQPFGVEGKRLSDKSLTSFDYAFAGLLGFAIIGLGIFGPINVFPELKKQGILRRLHTTPIRVWQYFLSTVLAQAIIGIVSLSVMFIVAKLLFHLKVSGNYLEIAAFVVFSVAMILGIGLAIGGWAKNERQAAPLGNIIVFPMLFLSGTFFPRFLMPDLLQKVTTYLPLTPVIDGLRLLTTEGKHLTDIGAQLALMAVWTVVIYLIAFRVFRWE